MDSFFMKKNWISFTSVAVCSATLAILFFWLATRKMSDYWQPTGDGKTIVNVRTGEIRATATGETIGRPVSLTVDEWRKIAVVNGNHFHFAQIFLLSIPKKEADAVGYCTPGGWRMNIQPFECDVFPDENTRNWLASGIARCLRDGTLNGPKWQELFDHLRALRYDKPNSEEWMIRTPEQLSESRSMLIGVKGR
jgi:hypothetical protein